MYVMGMYHALYIKGIHLWMSWVTVHSLNDDIYINTLYLLVINTVTMNPSPHSFMKNLGPHSLMDMNPEQIKEMISKLEIIPCPEYDGIMWPSFMPFRIKGAEKAIKEIMAFPSRESDIMICTHGKSGEFLDL